MKWSLVVVDEAQRMKNKSGKLQQTLHNFKWQQCVLLTGTPLQVALAPPLHSRTT